VLNLSSAVSEIVYFWLKSDICRKWSKPSNQLFNTEPKRVLVHGHFSIHTSKGESSNLLSAWFWSGEPQSVNLLD